LPSASLRPCRRNPGRGNQVVSTSKTNLPVRYRAADRPSPRIVTVLAEQPEPAAWSRDRRPGPRARRCEHRSAVSQIGDYTRAAANRRPLRGTVYQPAGPRETSCSSKPCPDGGQLISDTPRAAGSPPQELRLLPLAHPCSRRLIAPCGAADRRCVPDGAVVRPTDLLRSTAPAGILMPRHRPANQSGGGGSAQAAKKI